MFILEDAQVPLEWVNKWKQSYIIFMTHFVYKISYLSWRFEKYLVMPFTAVDMYAAISIASPGCVVR